MNRGLQCLVYLLLTRCLHLTVSILRTWSKEAHISRTITNSSKGKIKTFHLNVIFAFCSLLIAVECEMMNNEERCEF